MTHSSNSIESLKHLGIVNLYTGIITDTNYTLSHCLTVIHCVAFFFFFFAVSHQVYNNHFHTIVSSKVNSNNYKNCPPTVIFNELPDHSVCIVVDTI